MHVAPQIFSSISTTFIHFRPSLSTFVPKWVLQLAQPNPQATQPQVSVAIAPQPDPLTGWLVFRRQPPLLLQQQQPPAQQKILIPLTLHTADMASTSKCNIFKGLLWSIGGRYRLRFYPILDLWERVCPFGPHWPVWPEDKLLHKFAVLNCAFTSHHPIYQFSASTASEQKEDKGKTSPGSPEVAGHLMFDI